MAAARLDRLSTLVERFAVGVAADPADAANLVIRGDAAGGPVSGVTFLPGGGSADDASPGSAPLFRASARWGGPINPLVSALPERIDVAVAPGDEIEGVASLLVGESRARRCGSVAVMDRLGEVPAPRGASRRSPRSRGCRRAASRSASPGSSG